MSSQQAKATETTENLLQHFLEYCNTHPDPKIQFHASNMILAVHSDASFMNKPKAHSTAAGFFWLKNKDEQETKMKLNGAIQVILQIIKLVCASTAESELAALFINSKEAIKLKRTLEAMEHKQPPVDITTDNETAEGIVKQTIRQNKSHAMNMQYFWVMDQQKEGNINVSWKPGNVNKVNYFTKHFYGSYDKKVRPIYLYEPDSPKYIRNFPNPKKQDSTQHADF